MKLLIRDERGIVGEIEIFDACHLTISGRAIRAIARIVEAHADPIRRCLATPEDAAPVSLAV